MKFQGAKCGPALSPPPPTGIYPPPPPRTYLHYRLIVPTWPGLALTEKQDIIKHFITGRRMSDEYVQHVLVGWVIKNIKIDGISVTVKMRKMQC